MHCQIQTSKIDVSYTGASLSLFPSQSVFYVSCIQITNNYNAVQFGMGLRGTAKVSNSKQTILCIIFFIIRTKIDCVSWSNHLFNLYLYFKN